MRLKDLSRAERRELNRIVRKQRRQKRKRKAISHTTCVGQRSKTLKTC